VTIFAVLVHAHGHAIGAKSDGIGFPAQVPLYLGSVSGHILANAIGQLEQAVSVHV
jgi:hypothetical protein